MATFILSNSDVEIESLCLVFKKGNSNCIYSLCGLNELFDVI